MRDAFNSELNRIASGDDRVLLLTADIGFQVFDQFRQSFPDRFYNVGVAEANMIGIATGLALSGKKPFVYTIIPFLTMRAFEQIRTDVCIQNQPVKLVGVGGGVSYGFLGPTHHSIVDISIMRSLPNMTVVCPCDPYETRLAILSAVNFDSPIYIRLGKNGEPNLSGNIGSEFVIGKGIKIREGNNAVIITTGSVLKIGMEVCEFFSQRGIEIGLINMHTIKPIDKELILDVANNTKLFITIEEHSIIGGLGSSVAEVLSESPIHTVLKRMGIKDCFNYGVGDQDYHLKNNGVSVGNICNIIKDELINE